MLQRCQFGNFYVCKWKQNKGHKIERTFNPIGGAQAIIYDEKKDILYGGSDPRKDGIALGY